ncbi:MAG TPA: hypothetical protein VFL93_06940 [Longimicrobiaceae bacterium]|nr:hypothetical protein [Longimicrobiaceae bacterium]
MSEVPGRVLLLFLDGVGIGADDARTNPFVRAELPAFRTLAGGRIPVLGAAGGWAAADACLGVAGLPQSGTGQTTLLTGVNAAWRLGRHFGPWVHTSLRDLLARENLLSRARAAGEAVAFANAYPPGFAASRGRGSRRPAAPPLAAEAAGVLTRHAAELAAGRAVASSITNDGWRSHLGDAVPEITPEQAGRVLAGVVGEARITLFAHYDTDLIGHRGEMEEAVRACERVDRFLCGLLDHLPADALLVVASDHGNLEDVTAGHTRNPVPVLAYGPGAGKLVRDVRSLTDVAPAILYTLGIERSD